MIAEPRPADEPEAPGDPAPGGPVVGARVLYVDDDAGLARLVGRTLAGRGFFVEHATSGAEGLERLAEGGIDVVALDHYMPGETGLDVLPAIRALPQAPPVIYVTGSEDSRVAVAALKAGAADYVWKDVGGHFRELLAEAVSTAIAGERLRLAKLEAERESRAARERAEMMLREVNHRVANSLALVASLVSLQQKAVAADTDPIAARDALLETQQRITAIAQVHRRLYTSQDVSAVEMDSYLAGLVEELDAAMRSGGRGRAQLVRLEADPGIRVTPDKAVAAGVVVTELVTNAHKYAYPQGSAGGEIRVLCRRAEPDAGPARVLLAVEDDGVGWSGTGPARGTGLGTRILRAMAATLQSSLDYDALGPGTRVSLVFEA